MRYWLKILCSNALYLIVGYLMLGAGINGAISPFFTAFIFALFYHVNDIKLYVFGVSLSALLHNFSLMSVVFVLNFLLVMILTKIVQKRTGKKLGFFLIFPLMFVGSLVELLFVFKSAEMVVIGIVNKLFELVFLYSYIVFFRGISVRGMNTRLAIDESLGLALIIAPIVLSSTKVNIFEWNLAMFLVPFCILMVCYLLGTKETFIFAIIAGLGASFLDLKLELMAIWILVSAGVCLVRGLGKLPMVFMAVIMQLITGFYFKINNTFSSYDLIPVLFAGSFFLAVPIRLTRQFKKAIENLSKELALGEIVREEERFLSNQLREVSAVFLDMHNIYKGMIVGGIDQDQVEESIKRDIVNNNCVSCIRYKNCYEGRGLTGRSLEELIKKGVSKGRVSLVDTPIVLASSCMKTNQVILNLNSKLEEYKNIGDDIKSEDEAKITMSNQLLGVSEILTDFEKTFAFGERAKREEEESLRNSFLYADIIARETCIFRKNGELNRVVIVIKNVGYKKTDVLKVLKSFFKRKLEIIEARYADVAGWQIISLKPASKYSVVVGVAKVGKEQKSGDSYVNSFIGTNKMLVALSDGIGSGEHANIISTSTINLIEKFYKAGFCAEHIVDNVNKVVSYKSGENFCAVDICVLDLDDGRADFIKRGGTPSVIKRKESVQSIEGDSLPIGVVENSKSKIVHYYLNAGDTVVLASDGVFDAFINSDNFSGYINNLPVDNMQMFANSIIKKALKLYHGEVRDDMTVVAVKIILNNN